MPTAILVVTLYGKYENVRHVKGLAVPLGYVVGPQFKLILMQYYIKGKVKSFGSVSFPPPEILVIIS